MRKRRRASDQLTWDASMSPVDSRATPSAHAAAPIGVLLANIGSPDAPTPRAVRRYLREFLGDPDVVRANRVVWWFVLNGLVLPLRSKRSARLYASIWTERGSPLID